MTEYRQTHSKLAGLTSICFIVCGTAWFAWSYHGPAVLPNSASPDEFSAERAIQAFRDVLGPEVPHVAGSAENRAVRDRLVNHLESLNLDVQEFYFEVNGISMTNVLAVIPGQKHLRPIMLATHYDSVSQGPGVGDAGACVAALLEAARIFQRQANQSELVRDVYILFTDGEEWVRDIGHGLNGAINFTSTQKDLLQRKPIVLNFDARGAAGPSVLYETGPHNAKLMQAILPSLPRPAYTGSSFISIYELLPNATDFTVFKQTLSDGVNFAFIGRPDCYHTADDNFENLDPRSVQHHGINAVAIANCLQGISTDDFQTTQNQVFFSVGPWIMSYSETWAIPFACVMLLACLWGNRKTLRQVGFVKNCVILIATLLMVAVGASVFGMGLAHLNRLFDPQNGSFSHVEPAIYVALWTLTLILMWLLVGALSVTPETAWATIWLGNAILGLAVAILLPGASYFMLFAGLVPTLLSGTNRNRQHLTCLAVAAASLVLLPLGYQISIGLGIRMGTIIGPICALVLAPLAVHFCSGEIAKSQSTETPAV